MKQYLFLFILLFSSAAFAQDVWTEGTTWVIDFNAQIWDDDEKKMVEHPQTSYTLTSSVEVEGVSYFPLVRTIEEKSYIVAYIRSERGDSLVYSRVVGFDGYLYPDMLLFDFTKSFEYGDSFRYGTDMEIREMYISNDYPIEYIHDVIEEGDCLPIWNDMIYKLGPVHGPLELFFIKGGNNGSKPKTTNVSHILFGTRKGAHAEIDFDPATGIVRRFIFIDENNHIYDLQGRKLCSIPEKGIYIKNGKKYIR
ncbi:MAG: hypothetical protein MJZ29_07875 [Bacteroidaceae bacterium]|nr:hypothetical protein [Bacteroidaceae bacterium]